MRTIILRGNLYLKAPHGRNIVVAGAADNTGAVDVVVDVLYPVHGVLPLLGLADPPLLRLL